MNAIEIQSKIDELRLSFSEPTSYMIDGAIKVTMKMSEKLDAISALQDLLDSINGNTFNPVSQYKIQGYDQ